MAPTTFDDLPPELLDHIATYLPTAQSVSNLGSTSKRLHNIVEKDTWQTFARTRFPSLHPSNIPQGAHKDATRALTALSRSWDRRAFVARYIEPNGDIRAFPGDKKIERWKRPRGQTIGFTPQMDCYEEIGDSWRERKEVLAFSAGAEICVRERKTGKGGEEDVRWMLHRPSGANEGRDDITSLHLLRPREYEGEEKGVKVMTGTANGDLQLLKLSSEDEQNIVGTTFTTEGLPVRSSSLVQEHSNPALLAANVGDTRVCLYQLDHTSNIQPSSSVDIPKPTNGRRSYRAWSTNFISSQHLAVGLGPSEEPIHVYNLTPSGLEKEAVRKFSLQNDIDRLAGEITLSGFSKRSTSSVYPIVPLPPSSSSASGSGQGQVFLSGAYDGIIRLHDLRSNQQVEQAYVDPTDDSAIYSLLPRGQETLVAGTSRHSLLKIFDLRLGAKAYSYMDATCAGQAARTHQWQGPEVRDWNLFLKPHSATYPGRGGGNNWARRSAESSVYSLTSPSPSSPYLYAGVENAVLELAFTSIIDRYPDPVFTPPSQPKFVQAQSYSPASSPSISVFKSKEVLDLASYEQTPNMKLMTQRSLWETVRQSNHVANKMVQGRMDGILWVRGLDERWMVDRNDPYA